MDLLWLTMAMVALLVATVASQRNLNEETIQIPALGRTMTLGMFYNIRTGQLIPGRYNQISTIDFNRLQ